MRGEWDGVRNLTSSGVKYLTEIRRILLTKLDEVHIEMHLKAYNKDYIYISLNIATINYTS